MLKYVSHVRHFAKQDFLALVFECTGICCKYLFMRFFTPFFALKTQPRPTTNMLKLFCKLFQFRKDICIQSLKNVCPLITIVHGHSVLVILLYADMVFA